MGDDFVKKVEKKYRTRSLYYIKIALISHAMITGIAISLSNNTNEFAQFIGTTVAGALIILTLVSPIAIYYDYKSLQENSVWSISKTSLIGFMAGSILIGMIGFTVVGYYLYSRKKVVNEKALRDISNKNIPNDS